MKNLKLFFLAALIPALAAGVSVNVQQTDSGSYTPTNVLNNTTTTAAGSAFTNQPTNDGVEVLSSNAGDTTQTVTIIGTTTGLDTVVVETVTLNGTTPVSTVKTDWGLVLAVKKSAVTLGTVTVRKATGDGTITAGLTAAVLSVGVNTVSAANQAAYNRPVRLVGSGSTTKQIGVQGMFAGAVTYDSKALNGTTIVRTNSSFFSVTEIYTGDLEATRTATETAYGYLTITSGGMDFPEYVQARKNTVVPLNLAASDSQTVFRGIGADNVSPQNYTLAYNAVPGWFGYMATGTGAAPTAVTDDFPARFGGGGFDGTSYAVGAEINFDTVGTWTTGSHGMKVQFYTTASGGISRTIKATITDTGNVIADANNVFTETGITGTGNLVASNRYYTGSATRNPVGYTLTAYGAGTAYSFTNTAAAVVFGTTSPTITIDKAGTYQLFAQVLIAYNGATVVAETATVKMRRTNNTAADVGQVVVIDLPVSTTLTNNYGVVNLPTVIYTTTNTNDVVTIFANVSANLAAGTIDGTAIGTSIVAVRLY